MCEATRNDEMKNEHIRGTTGVAPASTKITERRINWYVHVVRGDKEDHIMRKVPYVAYQECSTGKVREDDRKQEGKTSAKET